MENSNTILVELDGFLFDGKTEESTPALRIYEKVNPEAKELIKDMQTYSNLIGTCNVSPKVAKILEKKMEYLGLKFSEIIGCIYASDYLESKKSTFDFLKSRHYISCYIDETEESPWHHIENLHRLKF